MSSMFRKQEASKCAYNNDTFILNERNNVFFSHPNILNVYSRKYVQKNAGKFYCNSEVN